VPAHAVDVVLGRPTDQSVTASVLAFQDGEGVIEFGMQPGVHPEKTPLFQWSQGEPIQVLIEYVRACLPQDENGECLNGKTEYTYTFPVK
jgi:hypothetical protein